MSEHEDFPSAGILFQMVMDEYSKERERTNALDSKSSFFITLIVAVATIFVPIIPFSSIIVFYRTASFNQRLIINASFILMIVSFILLTVAFIKFYNAYRLTKYKRPNLDLIDDDSFHIPAEDIVKRGLCKHYKGIVDYNVAVNKDKCDSINKGVGLCSIGFLFLIISAISILITLGG